MKLSAKVEALRESPTLEVTRRAKELAAAGHDVVTFGVGQPDFPTPDKIRQAATQALNEGRTGYAIPSSGLLAARQAVCGKFLRDCNLHYEPAQAIVTVGGKEALFLAFTALLDDGDEVILPAPYWVSYPDQIRLAGGRPVIVQGDPSRKFRITPAQLKASLTPRTRAVVLNYPSNPGGFTYDRQDLEEIAAVLQGTDVVVLSDEMYDRLTYGCTHVSFAALDQDTYARTITFNATSKSYAMTGWRLGFAAGAEDVIAAMAKLQSQTTSGATHFGQYGLIEALTGDQQCVEQMRAVFDRRRQLMYDGLCRFPGVTCVEPAGAFYCFPDVSGTYARLGVKSSVEFASKVLNEVHVAVVPGAAFGCDRHVRLAYAVSDEHIAEGLGRLQRLLAC